MIKTRLTGLNIETIHKTFENAEQVYSYMRDLGLSVTENEKAIYKGFESNWEIRFPFEYKTLCIARA